MQQQIHDGAIARRPRVLTIDGAAETLSISRSGIYRLLDRGELKAVRIGSRRMISIESIDTLLEQAA